MADGIIEHLYQLETDDATKNVRQLQSEVERLNRGLESGNERLDAAGQKVGDYAGALGRLVGPLERVNPQLSELALLGADVGDAFESLAFFGGESIRIFQGISAGGPAAVAVVAAIGTAAIASANYFDKLNDSARQYTDIIDGASRATQQLMRSQNALNSGSTDIEGFIGNLEVQSALLRGDITDGDVLAGELGNQLADQIEPRLATARQELAANTVARQGIRQTLTQRIQQRQEERGSQFTVFGDSVGDALQDELRKLDAAAPQLEQNLKNLEEAYERGRRAIGGYVAATEAAGQSTQRTSGAVGASVPVTSARIEGAQVFTVERAPVATVVDTQAASSFRFEAGADPNIPVFSQSRPEGFAANLGNFSSDLTSGASQLGGFLSNPAAGAAAALGPVGIAISAVSALSNLADPANGVSAADGLEDQLTGLNESLISVGESLPEILTEVIPEFTAAFVTDVVPAIVQGFFEAAREIVSNLFNNEEEREGDTLGQRFGQRALGLLVAGIPGAAGAPEFFDNRGISFLNNSVQNQGREARSNAASRSRGNGNGNNGTTVINNVNTVSYDAEFYSDRQRTEGAANDDRTGLRRR